MTQWRPLLFERNIVVPSENVRHYGILSRSTVNLALALLYSARWPTRWDSWGTDIPDYVDLAEKELTTLLDCDDFLACFDSDGWREKIREIIINDGGSATDDMEVATQNNDLDCVWGACIGTIDFLFSQVNSVLDILDAAANIIDAVSDVIDDFQKFWPITVTTIDAIANMLELALSAGTSVIRALMTQQLKESYACDLFCRVQSAGGPPYQLTRAMWQDFIGEYFFGDNRSFLEYTIGGMFYPIDIPFVGPTTLLSEAYIFQRYTLLAGDNCNDDWLTLCDCGWTHTIDLTQATLPTYVSLTRGYHVPNSYVESEFLLLGEGVSNQAITAVVTLPSTAQITSVRRVGYLSGPRGSTPFTELDYIVAPNSVVRIDATPGNFDRTDTVNVANATAITIYVLGGPSTLKNTLSTIELTGLGTNPFA